MDLDGEIWLWGIDYFEMSDADYAKTAADEFTEWVNETASKDAKPIIIVSHMPMHARRGDNKGGAIWLEAINEAAKTNDILFFWGHNHTGWNSVDQSVSHVAPGGSITPYEGSSTKINFTYALADTLERVLIAPGTVPP